jgi:WD40 repeat protein
MRVTSCGRFLISASDDGICKVWDIVSFTDCSNDANDDSKSKKNKVSPYRVWNPHSLSVKDFHIIGGISNLRVLSSSLDKTIVIYDVYSAKQCFNYTFPNSIEAVTANSNMDFIFGGSSSGVIYRLNFSTFSHSYNQQAKLGLMLDNNKNGDSHNIKSMIGHTSNITCLQCSIENNLISSSLDGSIRIWNIISGQCLKEMKPFQKKAITDFTLIMKSDQLDDFKNVIIPFEPLKKYDNASVSNGSSTIPKLGTRLIGSNYVVTETKKRKRDNEW